MSLSQLCTHHYGRSEFPHYLHVCCAATQATDTLTDKADTELRGHACMRKVKQHKHQRLCTHQVRVFIFLLFGLFGCYFFCCWGGGAGPAQTAKNKKMLRPFLFFSHAPFSGSTSQTPLPAQALLATCVCSRCACRESACGNMRLLTLRVPRVGLWQELQSSVNPQGPHAVRAQGCRLGIPRAAAAPATMLQRLAALRRKECHSSAAPRRRRL